jgi:hypothetical protein
MTRKEASFDRLRTNGFSTEFQYSNFPLCKEPVLSLPKEGFRGI